MPIISSDYDAGNADGYTISGSNVHLTIEEGVTLTTSAGYSGVNMGSNGFNWVQNNGTINAGGGITTSGLTSYIWNAASGHIFGYNGIWTSGDFSNIVNDGAIFVNGWGVTISAADGTYFSNSGAVTSGSSALFCSGSSGVVISNSGTLRSSSYAIQVSSGGTIQLTNSGTIEGDSYFGNASTTFRNSGHVEGDVMLAGSGGNLFDGRGGTVSGAIISGGGADRLIAGNDGASIGGGGGNDTISGGAGIDFLDGGDGNDTLDFAFATTGVTINLADEGAYGDTYVGFENVSGSGFADTLRGDGGANALSGQAGADKLYGLAGNDTLDGGRGADRMEGGDGADTYYVDNAGDVVIEANVAGVDTVNASVTFSLAGQYIENLVLTGLGDINGTGNSQANRLTGNAGANDLDGGAGADTMTGGLGDDDYYVDNVGDRVVETQDQGLDRVYSSVTFSLAGQHVERLALTGSANINGTGNSLDNRLFGNAGANVLDGGGGNDRLAGGAGADTFAFTTALKASNVDTITDFVAADDTIRLENGVFVGLAAGALAADAFYAGTAAHDSDDRIIYDQATGALFFDRDGTGGAYAAVRFAILENHAAVTAADFVVV
ncbi:calcium-binding protein [Hansschlegelia sp.]|uniref:calcium-binding protein n=1 Tax=Hansschlegelia sp. TaxID=2041892 RepID=UPI002C48190C|nr:calcium-binding protein [Hansschlegelia sp.]HVI30190.1 calcium-binding protein [Hansschlegelia sp.]